MLGTYINKVGDAYAALSKVDRRALDDLQSNRSVKGKGYIFSISVWGVMLKKKKICYDVGWIIWFFYVQLVASCDLSHIARIK